MKNLRLFSRLAGGAGVRRLGIPHDAKKSHSDRISYFIAVTYLTNAPNLYLDMSLHLIHKVGPKLGPIVGPPGGRDGIENTEQVERYHGG